MDQTTTLGNIVNSKEITTYTDADDMDGFYCQIPLIFTNIESRWHNTTTTSSFPQVLDMQMTFSIRARQVGTTGTWTKMLNETGTTLTWIAYQFHTTVNGDPNDMINLRVTNIPNGKSQRNNGD